MELHCSSIILLRGEEMNYKEAREYLKEISRYGSVLGLDSIKRLLKTMGNPEKKLKVVHVAGTNGKGSTCAFLQSILMEAGYKVGRYSSPAVFDDREIIRINDEYIKKDETADIITWIKEKCDYIVNCGFPHPTPFEVETAMAFSYFAVKECDIVIVECGMGGETDATNVFERVMCSIITTISLDHTKFLGETIEDITKVKAGIIKEKCPVVLSEQTNGVENIIERICIKRDAPLTISGKGQNIRRDKLVTLYCYRAGNGKQYNVTLNLLGTYQIKNSITAIEAALTLEKQGFHVEQSIERGVEKAKWQGRLEVIHDNPYVVIDGAHNPSAVRELKSSIDLYFTNKKITFIMGVLADKDFQTEIELIGKRAVKIITVTPDNERALEAEKLAETIKKYNDNVETADDINQAVAIAFQTVCEKKADMILAFGSLSYLGDFKIAVEELL